MFLFFKLGDVLRSLPMLTVKMGLLIANSEDEMKSISISNEQERIPCSTECILNVIIGRDRKYKVSTIQVPVHIIRANILFFFPNFFIFVG